MARTSASPETFIYIAADSVHLGGEFRPSESIPLPEFLDVPGLIPRPCPRQVLLDIHPRKSATLPFLGLDPSFPENLADAEQTIRSIQDFDFDETVFVVYAHDVSLFDILDFYPKTANDWKQKVGRKKVDGRS